MPEQSLHDTYEENASDFDDLFCDEDEGNKFTVRVERIEEALSQLSVHQLPLLSQTKRVSLQNLLNQAEQTPLPQSPLDRAEQTPLPQSSLDRAEQTPLPQSPLDQAEQIPLPPEQDGFSSMDEAIKFIHKFSEQHGFSVSKSRAKKNKAGQVRYQQLNCTRSKRSTNTRKLEDSERKRLNRGSAKTNCLMNISIKAENSLDPTQSTWSIRYSRNPESQIHNHPPARTPAAIAGHRSRAQDIQVKQMISDCYFAGLSPAQTIAILKQNNSGLLITSQDVYNYRKLVRSIRIGNLTVVEATITELRREHHFVRYVSFESKLAFY